MSLFSNVLPEGEFVAAKCDMLDRLIAVRDGNAALLYLYILRHGRQTDGRQAMRDLRLTQEQFDQAAFTLTNLTISHAASAELSKPKATPRYTASELRAARTGDHRFHSVCAFAESVLNGPLTEGLLRALFTIYDFIGLPAEVMMELIAYLQADQGAVSARDLLREAYVWSDKALLTVSDAQSYLSTLQLQKPLRDAVFRILGAVGRAPTPAEKALASYCIEKGFPEESVQLAYDRMMRHNGAFSFNYLKKVLQSWDSKNVHTVSEITSLEPERRAEPAPQAPAAPGAPSDAALSDWERDWLAEINRRKSER